MGSKWEVARSGVVLCGEGIKGGADGCGKRREN